METEIVINGGWVAFAWEWWGWMRKSDEWGLWGNDEKQVFQIVTRPQNEKKNK